MRLYLQYFPIIMHTVHAWWRNNEYMETFFRITGHLWGESSGDQ